eukprot:SAG31_NODE_1949_length_6833_cov_4.354024_5_plen_89_part_00
MPVCRFLRLAICYTLAAVEVTSPELVGNLAAKLGDFVVAMNTAPDAKAAAVAQALKWLLDAFAPDIIALEEYNSEWLGFEGFSCVALN